MTRTKEVLSTIQIASRDQIIIAHLAIFETNGENPSQLIPPNLQTILSSKTILKLGNGIQQDTNLCHKYLGIACYGLIDLRDLHYPTIQERRRNGEDIFGWMDEWEGRCSDE